MVKKVAVMGQGYVGLPIALTACEAGFEVIGVDLDQTRILDLKSGLSRIEDVADIKVKSAISSDKYRPTTDYEDAKDCKIFVICVPTPLSSDKSPDLTAVRSAAEKIAKILSEGSLVIMESTVEPGTTRDFLLPILEKGSGLGRDQFFLAFSPERIDPTNTKWNLKNTPKIVSGYNQESEAQAVAFYSKFIDQVITVESLEVAETAKLLENSFRFINISFINEFSMFCNKLGINVNHVISAASSKPYGFMPFYPSVGVGGHCIPVDPIYLANKARNIGHDPKFIDLAAKVNDEMPIYHADRAEQMLGTLKGKRVLVVGVTYKPNVADVRETPVKELINSLIAKGAQVDWHDELVKSWEGRLSVELNPNYDLAILATKHDYIDLKRLGDLQILDTMTSI